MFKRKVVSDEKGFRIVGMKGVFLCDYGEVLTGRKGNNVGTRIKMLGPAPEDSTRPGSPRFFIETKAGGKRVITLDALLSGYSFRTEPKVKPAKPSVRGAFVSEADVSTIREDIANLHGALRIQENAFVQVFAQRLRDIETKIDTLLDMWSSKKG